MVRIASVCVVLFTVVALAGCATFCDDEDTDPSAPLAPYEHCDERGRRCVDANIFDAIDALREADQTP